MSRSNPTVALLNPAKKFIEWSGSEGKFKFYDKDKKESVFIELPFTFLVLDRLSTCKGWNESDKIGYWSNEVRNTKTDLITVRSKNGIVMTGVYEQVKEKLSSKGLDYIQSVYVCIKEGKDYIMANLQLKGSALGPFIEFSNQNNINEIAIQVKSFTNEKKGATKYMAPVYSAIKVAEATNQIALDMDKELQEYLSVYLSKNNSESTETIDETQDNGLNKVAQGKPEVMEGISKPLVSKNTSDDLGELDDIPF